MTRLGQRNIRIRLVYFPKSAILKVGVCLDAGTVTSPGRCFGPETVGIIARHPCG